MTTLSERCDAFFASPFKFRNIRESVSDFIDVQSKLSGQFVNGPLIVDDVEDFEPAVVDRLAGTLNSYHLNVHLNFISVTVL